MIAPLIVLVVVLAAGLGSAVLWGTRQRRTARTAHGRVEQARTDGERRLVELREAHAALQAEHRRVQTQAGEAHRELAALSYSVSHDLRAPLRSVDGFSQALAEDYGHSLNSTAHDYLRRVRANAQHMSDLIDRLLALSRIVRANLRPEWLDLSAMATEAAAEIAAANTARRVEWDIQPGVRARGDRALIDLALRHLLGNAWKFTARKPTAHIAFHALPAAPTIGSGVETGVVYQVRDDGAGFDMQYAGKLFGAFQRMHPPEEFAGHGIGLATVQRIVRQHGGTVWVDAAPDQGAVFSFTLDAAVGQPTVAEPLRPALDARVADPGISSQPLPRTTVV